MKTIKNVINDLTEMLATFGDLPVMITEENEPGKPLTPLKAAVVLEAGLENTDGNGFEGDYDSICILSTSYADGVLDRITKNL